MAAEEYDRLVASAAAEAEFERQRAREEVTRQVGAIVMAATELVVAAEIDATLQRVLHRRDDRCGRGDGMRDLLRGYATAVFESVATAGHTRR